MIDATTAIGNPQSITYNARYTRETFEVRQQTSGGDTAIFGSTSITYEESITIVLDRSYARLQDVVGDARAALGLSTDQAIDTSPEATANRIADFALNFFAQYVENHPELADADAKQAFVDFIGQAIAQGIEEARGILDSLNALNPQINSSIDSISEVIQQRLDAFLNAA